MREWNYTCYEVKTENRAVFVACMAIVGVLHTPVNEILTKKLENGVIHAAGGSEKNTTPGRSPGSPAAPKRPQIGAAWHHD